MKSKHHHNAALLAATIYAPSMNDVREEILKLGFPSSTAEIFEGFGPLKERAMVVPMSDVVYVIFRGTVNRPQWISNALGSHRVKLFPTRGKERLHKGFFDGFKNIQIQLDHHLTMWKDRKIVLCGHSRGAAEALIAAQILDAEGYDLKEIHLFGCPRVFDKLGAKKSDQLFGSKTWRWVANNDTACRFPLRWMGFRHCGQEMYFDASDRLHDKPSLRVKLLGQYLGRKRGGWLDGLSDHNAVDEYVRLITKV